MGGSASLGVRALREQLAEVLAAVRAGAVFQITSHGQVIAELRPPASTAPRQPGALKGGIVIEADFDALPDDLLAAIERD